jgi:5,5'-dehydrodivanillate O-demethylase
MRKQFLADLAAIERGEDPKGVIRDPAVSHRIELPIVSRTPWRAFR